MRRPKIVRPREALPVPAADPADRRATFSCQEDRSRCPCQRGGPTRHQLQRRPRRARPHQLQVPPRRRHVQVQAVLPALQAEQRRPTDRLVGIGHLLSFGRHCDLGVRVCLWRSRRVRLQADPHHLKAVQKDNQERQQLEYAAFFFLLGATHLLNYSLQWRSCLEQWCACSTASTRRPSAQST